MGSPVIVLEVDCYRTEYGCLFLLEYLYWPIVISPPFLLVLSFTRNCVLYCPMTHQTRLLNIATKGRKRKFQTEVSMTHA